MKNKGQAVNATSSRRWNLHLALTCALYLVAEIAYGQSTLTPYASAHIEYDSNVYRLENSEVANAINGDPALADSDLKYVAGLDGTYLWGLQKLTGTIEGREIDYDHFTQLDHSEYLLQSAYDWKIASVADGEVGFRQEHLAAPFEDNNSTQLTLNTDRNIDGKANVNLNADWRLESGVYAHTLYAPLLDYPDFVEHEVGSQLGLKYLGVTNIAYGVSFLHINGNYQNAPDVGPYSQNTEALNIKYTVSALSSLNAAVGYTQREQSNDNGNNSALTGQFGYSRQVTAKTKFTVQFTRAVNSYLAAGGSEVDTTATASVDWQATFKTDLAMNYAYTHSSFAGQAIPGSVAAGRVDHTPSGSIVLTYQALHHLRIRCYANYQARTSNIYTENYSDMIYGIEALVRWPFY